jgi:hypothetical protein
VIPDYRFPESYERYAVRMFKDAYNLAVAIEEIQMIANKPNEDEAIAAQRRAILAIPIQILTIARDKAMNEAFECWKRSGKMNINE